MIERRGFLAACTWLLGSIPVIGTLVVTGRVGLAPSAAKRPTRVPLCRIGDLPTGIDVVSRTVTYRARRGPAVETIAKTVLVTHDDDGELIAMLGECTHLACPVRAREIEPSVTGDEPAPLRCPCHGGAFSRLGEVVAGPPPAPLRRLRLELPSDGDGLVHVLDL